VQQVSSVALLLKNSFRKAGMFWPWFIEVGLPLLEKAVIRDQVTVIPGSQGQWRHSHSIS